MYVIHLYVYFIQQQLSTNLKQTPDTFENLKSVLATIADIRHMSLDVELRFSDIKEKYRTLAMYKVEVLCVLLYCVVFSRPLKSIVVHFLYFFCLLCVGWRG